MTTPPIPPPILKRLMSLDTPIARRIVETGLFGLLMWGCAWCMEPSNKAVPEALQIMAWLFFYPGMLVEAFLLFSIVAILKKEIKSDQNDGK